MTGEQAARSYPIEKGRTVLLIDFENHRFWIKSIKPNGLESSCEGHSFISDSEANSRMNQQNCCCENRSAIADVKYAIATENCADRAAISDGIRDLMAQNTANTQAIVNSTNAGFQGIMDKLCQLELNAKDDKIADLQSQLNRTTIISDLKANNEAQSAYLVNRINPTPIPAYYVQNPNCCNNNYYGSGCGCGAA